MLPETFRWQQRWRLTILKNEKTTKGSMNLKRLKAGWDENYLSQLLQDNNF